jgi:hypothetical protein
METTPKLQQKRVSTTWQPRESIGSDDQSTTTWKTTGRKQSIDDPFGSTSQSQGSTAETRYALVLLTRNIDPAATRFREGVSCNLQIQIAGRLKERRNAWQTTVVKPALCFFVSVSCMVMACLAVPRDGVGAGSAVPLHYAQAHVTVAACIRRAAVAAGHVPPPRHRPPPPPPRVHASVAEEGLAEWTWTHRLEAHAMHVTGKWSLRPL